MVYSEENISQFFSLIASNSSTLIKTENNCTAVFTPGYAWPNSIYKQEFQLANLEVELAPLFLKMREDKMPKFIRLQPSASPKLIAFLKKKALRIGYWTAMSMKLEERIQIKQPAKIKRITQANQLVDWIAVLHVELMQGGEIDPMLLKRLLSADGIRFFGAYLENKLVSTAISFCKNGIVGIYLIATSSEYRGKGIGKQITAHCLNNAFKNGCHTAHLQSTSIGKPVYESVGFQDQGKIRGFLMYET